MTIWQAFLLGIIQGLTEFIPVSSTAHLLIAQKLFGLPSDEAMFSFLVIVQLGTLLSLIVYYWKDLWEIAKATLNFRVTTHERNLGFYIIIATIPALLAGYFLKDLVKTMFETPLFEAAVRLLTAALLLALAEWLGRRMKRLKAMNWRDALVIGLFQIIAVFPGASRSGVTISGGMLRGLDRPAAARFAFLMSVPVMLAAGGYQMLDVIKMPGLGQFLPLLAIGFIAAAIVGWFAIRWLITYLSKRKLYVFAAYCALVGLAALAIQFFWK